MNAANHLPEGTLLKERYRLSSVLGEGGFGITYRGFDELLQIPVAVKEYFPKLFVTRVSDASCSVTLPANEDLDSFLKGKESFLTEARVLAQFQDEPAVVSVKDFFEANDTAYIVMEYVAGRSLREMIEYHGNYSIADSFRMLRPLMITLGKIHEKGIIHRDISPANIMVLPDGSVKLLDFGAARFVYPDFSSSLSIIMKPGYTPQEQYTTQSSQGPWTDIYALCATIYHMITGAPPMDSLQRLMLDDLRKPSELGISIDPAVESALMKGLSLAPNSRFQTMEELLHAFDTCLTPKVDGEGEPGKKRLWLLLVPVILAGVLIAFLASRHSGTPGSASVTPEQVDTKAAAIASSEITSEPADSEKAMEQTAETSIPAESPIESLPQTASVPETTVEQTTDASSETAAEDYVVVFQDEKFEAAFRKEYEIDGTIYRSDILSFTDLSLASCGLTNIADVAQFQNLTHLNLFDNRITDISPVSNLTKLTSLSFQKNRITDISALSNLTDLADLYLSSNSIQDISALSGMTHLLRLYMSSNEISDISGLSGLTELVLIDLSYNHIENISALSGKPDLHALSLWHNDVRDISALSGSTDLSQLWLGGNNIRDISALSELTQLKDLEIFANEISDISGLSELTLLSKLKMSYNKISDISALKKLQLLTDLRIEGNTVSDISVLSNLKRLEHLLLSDNQISDITALRELTYLKELSLSKNQFRDVSALYGLTELEELYIRVNNLTEKQIEELQEHLPNCVINPE